MAASQRDESSAVPTDNLRPAGRLEDVWGARSVAALYGKCWIGRRSVPGNRALGYFPSFGHLGKASRILGMLEREPPRDRRFRDIGGREDQHPSEAPLPVLENRPQRVEHPTNSKKNSLSENPFPVSAFIGDRIFEGFRLTTIRSPAGLMLLCKRNRSSKTSGPAD